MTFILNDADRFAAEMIEGLANAHGRWVRAVPGGVVRSTPAWPGKVAVVVGGGSGHYPAFAGFVGEGLADGAAIGDVFASPSAQRIVSVSQVAHRGGGVLLTFGNYAGDVLNFTQAADRLNGAGVNARTLAVTDDIASAPAGEEARRRGIAGGLIVFKIASAAAEQGLDLDEVCDVARLANERTRTLGVAFGGCRLPGADRPLFSLPQRVMGLGMGIHGEPGVGEEPILPADTLAEVLVSRLVAEQPAGAGNRVAVVLNGLGATPDEELFVLWRAVSIRLHDVGLHVVEPDVGRFVTSLDTAGCSLSLCWLGEGSDTLSRFWAAPADTPAYGKGRTTHGGGRAVVEEHPGGAAGAGPDAPEMPAPSTPDRDHGPLGAAVVRALRAMHDCLVENERELGRLDAVAGDGDHGRGMVAGSGAAVDAAARAYRAGLPPAAVVYAAADAWADRAGGTSGALWGAGMRAFGEAVADLASTDVPLLASAVRQAVTEIERLGGARLGDKTMIDAAVPFAETLVAEGAQGSTLAIAWRRASRAATAAAQATAELCPRVGRARPLATRSVGSADPGAVSFALAMQAIADSIEA